MRFPWAVVAVLATVWPVWSQGWEEGFDAGALGARWEWRVPVEGPTVSLADAPGWLRIRIPEREQAFNHWDSPQPVDDAPQLRAAAPEGDWMVEARIRLHEFDPAGQFQAGLMIGASDTWLATMGPLQAPALSNGTKTPEVWLEPTGSSGFVRVPGEARDVWLRLVRAGSICRGQVSRDGNEWADAGACILARAPRFVGVIGKTFSSHALAFDVDYVRITPVDSPAECLRVGIAGDYPTGYHGLLARQGLPHEVLVDYQLADPRVLGRFDLLFVGAVSGGLRDRAQEALAGFVESGGIAVLDTSAYPLPRLVPGKGGYTDQLAAIVMGGTDNPLSALMGEGTRLEPGETRFHFEPASEVGLQVLARYDGRIVVGGAPSPVEGYTGSPAVWARPLGRGLIIYSAPAIGASLSWGPVLDPLADALVRLLGGSRYVPQLVAEGVRLGRKEVASGDSAQPAPAEAEPEESTLEPAGPRDAPLPDGATLVEGGEAAEFNLTGTYYSDRGDASLLLHYRSRSSLVRVDFQRARAAVTLIRDGQTADAAEIPLERGTSAFLVKARSGRVGLSVGSRQAVVGDGPLWEGRVASTGSALADLVLQPVEPVRFDDDFMRGEDQEGPWEVVSGEWATKAEGDPKMGVNPFNYQGQARGVGLATAGWPFWDEYEFSVSARPTQAGTVGQALYYQDAANHLLFRARVSDTPNDAAGGLELVRVKDGQERIVAQGDGCLVTGHWYRLTARVLGGTVSAALDGQWVLWADENSFPGGRVALYLKDCRSEFDDVEVRAATGEEAPALVELDGSVPPFAGTLDRDTWAGTALQWRPVREEPGLFWRRGRFHGDFELSFQCNFGEARAADPSLTLLLTSELEAPGDGFAIAVAPRRGERECSVELTGRGRRRRTTVTASASPVVTVRRTGGALTALLDGRPLPDIPADEAAGELSCLGFRAQGFRPRLSGLELRAGNVLDDCFDRAPTPWWVSSGEWAISSRWPCTAEWSWFGGRSKEVAAIWHKRRFEGDIIVDSHIGPWEIDHGDGTPREICRAFNLVLCGDGEDVNSGYSFVLGADEAGSGATLSRAGRVVARNDEYRIYSDAHNQWLNIRAEKRGRQVGIWIADQPILVWEDPEPLPSGRVGIWTRDNGIMIPRVTIYYQAMP